MGENIASKWKAFAKENYHLTTTLFWIRMLKVYRKKYLNFYNNKGKEEKKEEDENDDCVWSFDGFIGFCKTKEIEICDESLLDLYYSEKAIKSDKAATEFVKPDKKALPK